ncbi:putative MFS family arabinose efflux permease [Paraburkholderia sp. BL23I1N1]|nr:putative MFS family arabinose efflux permease [Paraburkholderia sp. BL23I1N1]
MTAVSSATEPPDTREPAEGGPAKSGYAGRALIASVLGYAMDGFDLLILGFMLPVIAADLHLSSAQSGSLVTWTLIGAVAGGLIFGVLSDYFGRVRMLTWTILIFAVFTGLCALAQGYSDLLIYRTIAGIGLGGEFGIGMTLVAEAWPASQRARVSSYVGLGWQLGVLAAALLTPLLLPLIGWRGMFALGLLPAVVSFFVRRHVEEPALFNERVARGMRKLPLKLLVADGRTTRASIGVAILCSVQNFGYYGLMIWLPSYLSKTFGYSLTKSGVWTAVTVLGMAAGIWLFGMAADRFGRKPTFLFLPGGRGSDGIRLRPSDNADGAADRRRGHGCVRQRDDRRLRRADLRALSHRCARHRAERSVQYRPGGWRFRAGSRGRFGCTLFVRRRARFARIHLFARRLCDALSDPGTTRRRARMTRA